MKPRPVATHAAALCVGDHGSDILLVRTSNDRSWTWPKGRIEPADRSSAAAALREAQEEAGVLGGRCISHLLTYLHPRQNSDGSPGDQVLTDFELIRITGLAPDGCEPGRRPMWADRSDVPELLAAGRLPDDAALLALAFQRALAAQAELDQ